MAACASAVLEPPECFERGAIGPRPGNEEFIQQTSRAREADPQSRPPPPPSPLLLGDVGGTGEAFFFEAPPEASLADCFQAVGTYAVGRDGVFFTFLRALPGNLNRFAIERNDINGHQGRVYFERGGCRVQITTSGFWKYNFEWAPLLIENPI